MFIYFFSPVIWMGKFVRGALYTLLVGVGLIGSCLYVDHAPNIDSCRATFQNSPQDQREERLETLLDTNTTLTLETYNIKGLPIVGNRENIEGIFRDLDDLAHQGELPQVFMIQEGFHQSLPELVNRSPYAHVFFGDRGSWYSAGSGLIILSQLPFSYQEFTPFSHEVSWDFLTRKGFQYVEVDSGDQTIGIYNVHFVSDKDKDLFLNQEDAECTRLSQNEQLVASIHEKRKKGIPLIVAGDFNMRVNDTLYRLFIESTGAYDTEELCQECTISVSALDGNDVFDHQFFIPGINSTVYPVRATRPSSFEHNSVQLSDHRPYHAQYVIAWMTSLPSPQPEDHSLALRLDQARNISFLPLVPTSTGLLFLRLQLP